MRSNARPGIGAGRKNYDRNTAGLDVLLMANALVHGDQGIKIPINEGDQFAVSLPKKAALFGGPTINVGLFEIPLEFLGKTLIQNDPYHRVLSLAGMTANKSMRCSCSRAVSAISRVTLGKSSRNSSNEDSSRWSMSV